MSRQVESVFFIDETTTKHCSIDRDDEGFEIGLFSASNQVDRGLSNWKEKYGDINQICS